MASNETRKMVLAAARVCEDKKGEDTNILELDPLDSGFTDYFLITSGINDKQTQAIADGIEFDLKKQFGTYPNSIEGRKLGEWILMDYVDFVIHIFLRERRSYYDIERLRKTARRVAAQDLVAALTKKTMAARRKAGTATIAPVANTASPKSSVRKRAATPKAAKSAAKKKSPVKKRTATPPA
ncbi:MAG: ribosome silencing factor [Silvibacterium sp.]|nr:ribosome silencing factor [Silvibacterium sp.]MBV8436939.1 ribosome silencing factor [Silvibacterium sp.]